jgi:SAM-dependent methyltransferase
MSATSVSVLLPLAADVKEAHVGCDAITRFLRSTGLDFEVLTLVPRDGEQYGTLLRRGISEAKGETIVIADDDLPYGASAIGDAIAMIQSGATDIVFATTSDDSRHAVIRWLLVDILPDPTIRLKAFSAGAARLAIAETKLAGTECEIEIAFLANKYGFRVEPLLVTLSEKLPVASGRWPEADPATGNRQPATTKSRRRLSFTNLSLGAVISIRMTARRMGYRASRRCPVCFASDVWTAAQIPGNIVRACSRCKCRYLNQFTTDDEARPVRRILRAHAAPAEAREESHSSTARDRTALRRLAALRKHLAPRARMLEIGVRDGRFGLASSQEFEYVGIDHAQPVARAARGLGLEVYCATLANFVNTGPLFDAIALFHVFENHPDPHDALARIKDLLKPGGVLFLTMFDTEGLLYLLTERKRMAHNFQTHLILYSRSALIELLEHSGFEIEVIGPDFEHRDHRFLRHVVGARWPILAPIVNALLKMLPDPLLVGTGSIRVIAKRRAGTTVDIRAVRSVEATHAR